MGSVMKKAEIAKLNCGMLLTMREIQLFLGGGGSCMKIGSELLPYFSFLFGLHYSLII